MKHFVNLSALLVFLAASTACSSDDPSADSDDDSNNLDDSMDPPATFENPESALWNAAEESYFVSNVAGESDAADGVGWIAKLDSEGEPVDARWVKGLNAPKGMALSGDNLYVADLTELLEIDGATGEILNRVAIPGAVFLNDVTASEDTVWISDTFAGAIFSYTPSTEKVEELAMDPALASINGLAFDGTNIIGGTIGDFTDPTDLGNFLSISLSGEVTVLASEVGKFDGIVARDGASFLATDFRGMLLTVDADGTTTVLKDLTKDFAMMSAADLGYDPVRNQVAIPDLFASTVVFIDLGDD